jgi:tellurite resistance protein TerC
MLLFWLGFFVLVALLLVLDLGVLHRKPTAPTVKTAIGWTIFWVILGLLFAIAIYLIYENHWLGADLVRCVGMPLDHPGDGADAVVTYLSAYLVEYALSIDNVFVMALLFTSFRVPLAYQHRVLFWGIIGAVGFRCAMLLGGAELAGTFKWIYYLFGGYLAYQGVKLLREGDDDVEDAHHEKSIAVRILRRFVRIVDGDHGGRFTVRIDGRFALTTVAVCLVVGELTDVVFALDSVPAVVLISPEKFVMVSSNVFAILGLRSLYFVLAGAMAQFRYLKLALAALLILIGVKMILAQAGVEQAASHVVTLVGITTILTAGVVASVLATRRVPRPATAEPLPDQD